MEPAQLLELWQPGWGCRAGSLGQPGRWALEAVAGRGSLCASSDTQVPKCREGGQWRGRDRVDGHCALGPRELFFLSGKGTHNEPSRTRV